MTRTVRGRPWPGSVAARLVFERGARQAFPSLKGRPTNGGFVYTVIVAVPFYSPRSVTVAFSSDSAHPTVLADGPSQSPHRFDDGSLCMWFPRDPAPAKWRFGDGLLDLLDTITGHLFREAWWRETGEWLGPEVGHQADTGGTDAEDVA